MAKLNMNSDRLKEAKYWVFDYGGVFVKSSNDLLFEKISLMCDKTIPNIRSLVVPYILKSQVNEIEPNEFWLFLAEDLGGIDAADLKFLWMSEYKKILRPDLSFLMGLKRKGCHLILLSNLSNIYRSSQNDFLELFKIFDDVYFSCDVKFRKPDAKAYEHVFSVSRVDVGRCVFLDDQHDNLEYPIAKGCLGIQVDSLTHLHMCISRALDKV